MNCTKALILWWIGQYSSNFPAINVAILETHCFCTAVMIFFSTFSFQVFQDLHILLMPRHPKIEQKRNDSMKGREQTNRGRVWPVQKNYHYRYAKSTIAFQSHKATTTRKKKSSIFNTTSIINSVIIMLVRPILTAHAAHWIHLASLKDAAYKHSQLYVQSSVWDNIMNTLLHPSVWLLCKNKTSKISRTLRKVSSKVTNTS